jgi:glycine/D-amino acid oxidase-like deaminating enzyme
MRLAYDRPVLVVGEGIGGLSVAFELAHRGIAFKLIAPQQDTMTASPCATGLSSMKGLLLPRQPLFELKFKGHHLLPYWIKRVERASGKKVPVIHGQIYEPAWSQEEQQKISKRVFGGSFTGLLHYLKLAEKSEVDTLIAPNGFQYPGDYFYDPDALLLALRTYVRAKAEDWIEDRVKRLCHQGHSLSLELQGESMVKGRSVVLCTGYGTQELLLASGLVGFESRLYGGETLREEQIGANDDFLTSHSLIFGAASLNIYPGFLSYGSSTWQTSLPYSSKLEDSLKVPNLLEELEALERTGFVDARAKLSSRPWKTRRGYRCLTKNRLPYIGPFLSKGDPRILIAAGFHKSGFTLAPMAARQIARMIAQKE